MRTEQEYQELVTKNHNLIYHCIQKHGVELSEYYDVLAIALCNAARNYREDGGAGFAQFAMTYMENAICTEYQHNHYQCRDTSNTCSLTEYETEEGQNDKTRIMQDRHDVVKDVILHDTFERAYQRFTKRQKEVFSLFVRGYRQIEIATMIGVTHQQVNLQMKKIRSKLALEIA